MPVPELAVRVSRPFRQNAVRADAVSRKSRDEVVRDRSVRSLIEPYSGAIHDLSTPVEEDIPCDRVAVKDRERGSERQRHRDREAERQRDRERPVIVWPWLQFASVGDE